MKGTPEDRRGQTFSDFWRRLVALSARSLRMNWLVCLFIGLMACLPVIMVVCGGYGLELSGMQIAIVNSDEDPELPELFLASLPNNTIIQSAYTDLGEARAAMERGEVLGIINIAGNFSTAIRSRFSGSVDIHESPIYIDFDSVNDDREIGFVLQKFIFDSSEAFWEKLRSENHTGQEFPAEMPLLPRHPIIGFPKYPFSSVSLRIGVYECCFLILHLIMTVSHVTLDAWDDTCESWYLLGVKHSEVAIASIFPQVISLVGEMVAAGFLLSSVHAQIGYTAMCLAIPALFLQILRGISLGLLIASVRTYFRGGLRFVVVLVPFHATYLPSFFFTGIICSPGFRRWIVHLFCATSFSEMILEVGYTGLEKNIAEVLIGFTTSIFWTGFVVSIAYIVLKFSRYS